MSFQKTLLVTLGLASLALPACASKKPESGYTIENSSFAGGSTVSFKNDVMPTFGFACTASPCHNPNDLKANLNLGPGCQFTPAPSGQPQDAWTCVYPDTVPPPGPSGAKSTEGPIDDTIRAAVYANLINTPAATVVSPSSAARVVPGDPSKSFLMMKMADTENDEGFKCQNQDTTKSDLPCGTFMPVTGEAWRLEDPTHYDLIGRWILQGAPNN